MKLKKYHPKRKKINLLFITLLITLLSCFLLINCFSKNINPILLRYAEAETKRLTTLVINQAITNQMAEENLQLEDLFEIVMNDNKEIVLINFNSINVTKMLNQTTNLVQINLKLLEEGNSNLLDLEDDNLDDGIVYYIPMGAITNISLLANIGPKIPIKLSLIGDVISNIETKVTEYGINNAMIEVGIYVEVSTMINLPLISKETKVSNVIPIAMKVISGKVPEVYADGFKSSSNIVEKSFE